MPFNFRLNVQQVFRQLGIQTGARLPMLNDNIQMVMQITDLERLIPAPVEPRGMAGVNLSPAAGFFSTVQILSLAPGGIFIENILLRADGFNNTENVIVQVTTTDLALTVSSALQIDVGGSPTESILTSGNTATGIVGPSIPMSGSSNSVALLAGLFVPNQSFFTLGTRTANERMDVNIIWRELPAVEEVG